MFVVNGADYTIIVIGAIGALLFFGIQLTLCFKAKRLAVKCIPLYLVLLGGGYALALWTGLLGTYSAGAISGNQLAAYVCGIVVGIASSGIALAWIGYLVVFQIRNHKDA